MNERNGIIAPQGLEDPMELLIRCGAFYQCPVDPQTGKRLGPLVAYTGTYVAEDGTKQHFVGPDYVNFAAAEEQPRARDYFARIIASQVPKEESLCVDAVLGVPWGGLLLAGDVSRNLGVLSLFAERRVTKAATEDTKEESEMVLGRHTVHPGMGVAVVEDHLNNLSSTAKVKTLIEGKGGVMAYILSAFNRSPLVCWNGIPIIAAIHRQLPEYQQDDPAVAEDVKAGNVEWNPKQNWPTLMATMHGAMAMLRERELLATGHA